VGGVIALVALTAALWYGGYSSRVTMVGNQREECERAKRDRAANARGWREAQRARQQTADDPAASSNARSSASREARTYGRIAGAQERRATIVCREAFVDPPLFQMMTAQ
jgi:hypothetical protein